MDKLGSYINKLKSTIAVVTVDKESEEFTKQLAWDELKRLSINIEEFLRKHSKDDSKERKQTEKQLLQEDKNVTNK